MPCRCRRCKNSNRRSSGKFASLEARKHIIERKIERQIRLFEQKRDGIGKKIEQQIKQFELKKGIRLDDEVRFIRSWIERPLSIGAVTPSGKDPGAHHGALCRSRTAPARWSNWDRVPAR